MGKLRGREQGLVRVAAIYSVGLSDMSRLTAELSRRMKEAELQVEYLRPEKSMTRCLPIRPTWAW